MLRASDRATGWSNKRHAAANPANRSRKTASASKHASKFSRDIKGFGISVFADSDHLAVLPAYVDYSTDIGGIKMCARAASAFWMLFICTSLEIWYFFARYSQMYAMSFSKIWSWISWKFGSWFFKWRLIFRFRKPKQFLLCRYGFYLQQSAVPRLRKRRFCLQ